MDIPRCPEGYWIPGFGAQERGLGRRWYLKLEGQIKSPRKCVWCKKRSQEDPHCDEQRGTWRRPEPSLRFNVGPVLGCGARQTIEVKKLLDPQQISPVEVPLPYGKAQEMP